jgi:hypothetical protein
MAELVWTPSGDNEMAPLVEGYLVRQAMAGTVEGYLYWAYKPTGMVYFGTALAEALAATGSAPPPPPPPPGEFGAPPAGV